MLESSKNRIWVDYDHIPKNMEHAAVAIEDKRFYEHKGVDWYRTAGAFVNMFLGMKNDFGGSTITQQLLKNTTQNDDVTVQRKLLEIFQAMELEKNYTKEEIIEWYLNVVYFGEGAYGIQMAADTYFGKDVSELTLAECASIVAITNNPSRYDPFISSEGNARRRHDILYQMYDQGYIDYEEYQRAVAEEPRFVRGENDSYEAPIYSYYIEVVIDDVLRDLVEKKGLAETAPGPESGGRGDGLPDPHRGIRPDTGGSRQTGGKIPSDGDQCPAAAGSVPRRAGKTEKRGSDAGPCPGDPVAEIREKTAGGCPEDHRTGTLRPAGGAAVQEYEPGKAAGQKGGPGRGLCGRVRKEPEQASGPGREYRQRQAQGTF